MSGPSPLTRETAAIRRSSPPQETLIAGRYRAPAGAASFLSPAMYPVTRNPGTSPLGSSSSITLSSSPPAAAPVCGPQVLDEGPYARRPAVLPTVQCVDGHRLGFPAWQHEPQRTALEVLVDQPRRQHGDAGSVNGECAQRRGGIAAKHCVHTHPRFALSMYENPAVLRVAGRVRKRVMLREGLWCSRFTALLQVGGRGHQDATK